MLELRNFRQQFQSEIRLTTKIGIQRKLNGTQKVKHAIMRTIIEENGNVSCNVINFPGGSIPNNK